MTEKVHDFRTSHKVAINVWHLISATLIMISELTIHALEIHLISTLFVVGVFAKDIICDIIEKCEEVCGRD